MKIHYLFVLIALSCSITGAIKKQKCLTPFYGIGFNCLKAAHPLCGDSLPLTLLLIFI